MSETELEKVERLEDLDFTELAERLAQVRSTRTAEGWGPSNAVTKSSLERRILQVVCTGAERTDESEVQVEYEIELEVQRRTVAALMALIRPGGLWIPSRTAFKNGLPATVKIRTEDNLPLKVRCVVRNREGDPHGIGLAFEELDGTAQRRVERLILELLKSREL